MAASKASVKKKDTLSRDTSLSGQTVSKDGYNVTYDSDGYATKASNYRSDIYAGTDKSVAARSADAAAGSADRSGYGGSSYDQSYFSNSEFQQAADLRAKAAAGEITWAEAHEYAERVRQKYGYSGGSDGSQYLTGDRSAWNADSVSGGSGSYSGSTGGTGGTGSGFSYGTAPSYVNRYQSQIDALTQQILNREAFSYDPETDPTYQQYRESYTKSGQRAMQDTLGQMAARTGGLAGSYAGSAAQQTYDGYMSALADKIPELRQLAYSMYQDEISDQRSDLNLLMALEQGDYSKFADQLSQYNADRNFDYGVFSDQRNYDYQVGRDAISDSRYTDETDYNRAQDAWQQGVYSSETAYSQALAKAQTLAAAGDFSGYAALGYSDAEISRLKAAWDREQAAAKLTGTYKSSGSSGSGSGVSSTSSAQDYEGLFQAARESGYAKSFINNNYKNYGFSSSSGLYSDYETWMETAESGGSQATRFSALGYRTMLERGSYEEADAYLQQFWENMTDAEKTRARLVAAQFEAGG